MSNNTWSLGEAGNFPEMYTGSALILHHPNEIPPHIGVIHNGLYFSLSVKGLKTEIPFHELHREIRMVNKTTVMVELMLPFYIQSPLQYFTKYTVLDSETKTTCLFPIRDWLCAELEEEEVAEIKSASFVFELMEGLKQYDRIGKTFAHNAAENPLVFKRYSMQDIRDEIKRKESSYARG